MIKTDPQIKYIFFLGTGRVGTKFMAYFFNKNFSKTYAVHEPSRMIKIAANKKICKVISSDDMEKYLKKYKEKRVDKILKNTGAHAYLESNSWVIGASDLIGKVFPSPYIIHIVRDPATYIPSHLNRIHATKIGGILRKKIPYWLLTGEKTGDYTRKDWKKLTSEEKMAWYWFKVNKIIEDSVGDYPKYLQLKYEDIFNQNYSGLKEIAKFIDLPPRNNESPFQSIKPVHETKIYRFQPFLSWNTSLKRKISITCSPFLEKYGYSRMEDR